ncbi:MAG: glycosyltransferase [Candidatus Methanomethylicia archaeon]
MKRKILIISMPFRLGIGGFLRSYNVLPRLTKLLAENDYELELYVPTNAIRTFASFLMSMRLSDTSKEREEILDELLTLAVNEVYEVQRLSKYTFAINEKILEENIEYNRQIFLKESKWKSSFHILYAEELRPVFIHFLEKRFANMVRHLIKNPSYAYSMHETADAITALTFLSSKETKTAVLLQLDLGKKTIHRTFNLNLFKKLFRKTKLCGILSVSPAPIIETPQLFTLCKNLEILNPGVAVEPVQLFKKAPSSKRTNAVIYYGRISREKGIFDLLRAWSIIEKKIDANLYIAGRFEDYRTCAKFYEDIKKYNLKTVKYLGYFSDRDKLFKIVSSASVLAYPSYRDSFSLTVLESLFMGLRVVAYEIPALSFLYRYSSNVELVPVGDFKRLAMAIISNIEKPFNKDKITIELLNRHSSWEKVAMEEYRKMSKILNLND